MSTSTPAHPPIVSRERWTVERERLLEREKALTRQRDALNAERRRLPMVRIDKRYEFQGADGKHVLSELFGGQCQLIVGHFMFDPAWQEGCPSCTHLADEIAEGQLRHLHDSDTAFVYVSRAPFEKIDAYRQRRGWTFPWYSSAGSDFNYDFHATLDESVAPVEYNYKDKARLEAAGFTFEEARSVELPGFSVFLQVDDEVFHTYSTYARGGESIGGSHYMLDLTAFGRQQDFEDSPPGWPQRPTYG